MVSVIILTMIPYEHRFHRRNHLRYVYEHGQGVRGKDISLKYLRDQKHDRFRMAVVVSKKVTKKATTRNRIRRRLYEIIRQQAEHIAPDSDFILSVFDSSIAKAPAKEVEEKTLELFKQAGLYK